ncbi:MAG: GMC family oxidoreductase [Myxococcales bacterium FL481]|nr:MAG: GMC family oxidoreductase [Myxococcales bacterium FL481]
MDDDDKTRGRWRIAAQIDAAEMAAFRGRLPRRDLLRVLGQLGVAAAVAGPMARRAEAAVERRRFLDQSYDYIVVGAGSAGCVMANRLSATGASVLLVEAGTGDVEQPKISDSTRWMENFGSETDWAWPSVPQADLGDRPVGLAGGKVLGGSGSINGMFWLRGDLRDAWRWRRLVGHPWTAARLYRAFLRVENFLHDSSPGRGREGAVSVGRYALDHPLTAASIAGAKELGLPEADHNAVPFIDGAGPADVNIHPDGRRSGPAQAYLLPAVERPNLVTLPDAAVSRLLVSHGRCRGIEVVVNGELRHIEARRETVVSAGAIGSPKLLMLSGIGPEAVLQAAGVPIACARPMVGRQLHDHVLCFGADFLAGPEFGTEFTLGGVSSHAFFRTNKRREAPNIHLMCLQTPLPSALLPPGEALSILLALVKPKSRGWIELNPADPGGSPLIDPGYLREPGDRADILEGFDRAIELGLSSPMTPFVAGLVNPAIAGLSPDEKLGLISQQLAGAGLHFTASCSAGRDPRDSVVDGWFRVWGVDDLRVVDASVLPEVPGVNTHVSVLTIAELAAEVMGC